jgi:hypothetical protein
MRELRLIAAATVASLALAACGPSEADRAAAVAAAAEADEAHFAKARELISAKLKDGATAEFAELAAYDNEGVAIVCGKATAAFEGQAPNTQRFIVVGGQDATIEMEMEDGEMDKAVTEFCQDFSPIESSGPGAEELDL